ncbi:MAG: glucuronate isomerase [Chloroflexi bacterium]|nr:glucuronate isomerase [Chloroflexota bacterium]
MNESRWVLSEDRFFDPDPQQRDIARHLYRRVKSLPIISPHGHVDPRMFADPDYSFGSPAELFIIPDHYVFRMLYSQGIPLERLGIPRLDGGEVERDPRKIWQVFAEHFYLFRGTPTGIWLKQELYEVFGIDIPLTGETAQVIYDRISERLASPEYRPRRLFERFNIEVLATTDMATSTLEHHQAIRASGWKGRVIPTFRPDDVIHIRARGWRERIRTLGERTGMDIGNYSRFIRALEERRAFFREMGATATDHATLTAHTERLSAQEADAIFQRALRGEATEEDAHRFAGHMIMESARMSIEDGLVMQWHVGAFRNHNQLIYERFGPDKGADIPIAVEFTRSLHPLLNAHGNDPRLTLILFTLDESTYARELAPLAGHYPALKLGPPWWFHDSLNGMRRYFDRVMETAGLYNTVGFNDDTRAFPSIPARHDVWRRASANWLAGLIVRDVISLAEGEEMAEQMAYTLAKKAYRLG